MDLEFLLIQLLLKMGVATAVASALGRSHEFKKLLFAARRSRERNILFVLFTCIPFALGVYFRFRVKNFQCADLGFEAAILVGVLGGRVAGTLGGAIMSLPALFYGEWLTLPVNAGAGFLAGSLRHFCRNEEE
ncbi:MAG TPA: sensor histidine kinase, partial [Candidatus Angelobacter sp.]|nr:sensor histidine kinase [Candidatus Angelobacter sp.]